MILTLFIVGYLVVGVCLTACMTFLEDGPPDNMRDLPIIASGFAAIFWPVFLVVALIGGLFWGLGYLHYVLVQKLSLLTRSKD